MYRRLALGEVGLIVAGHAYIDRGGKCHPEMTAIDRDEVVPHLKRLTDAAHAGGGEDRASDQLRWRGLRSDGHAASLGAVARTGRGHRGGRLP